jgi:glycosyltransferase involved in cell wall biosynthesis
MNVLILNWRDIKNPQSGGAEILTHEIAKRMIGRGNNIVHFSANFNGSIKEEKIDGVTYIRNGHPDARTLFSSVHWKAFLYYRQNHDKFDLTVDEIHGVPFLTPLYVRGKKIALICEIAGNLWDIAVAFPFNIFGKVMEKTYSIFYKDVPVVTISESSKEEIERSGFVKDTIKIIHPGCDMTVVKSLPKKYKIPTVIFIARLSRTKGVEDAIDSIVIAKKEISKIRLLIVGKGDEEYTRFIKEKISNLGLQNNVFLKGYISEKEKENLLTYSHILISPSVKEGWGLTVHEAGSRGTPSVVYNVEGLRDVVRHGLNGLVCSDNNPRNLADNIMLLMRDKKLYDKLQTGAIEQRRKYDWDRTVDEFLEVIK